MKLADVVGALRRRWYIVLVGILAAGGAFLGVWNTVPSEYERTATQLLLPGAGTIPEDANPYLFVGGLYQVADILVRAIGPEDVAAATEGHDGADVAIERDTAAGAVLITTVTATNDAGTAAVLAEVLELTEQKLTDLQDGQRIPADERIELVPLTRATTSEVIQKNRLLYASLSAAATVAIGAGIAVLTDTLLRSRRRARATAASAGDDRPAPSDADADTPPLEPAGRRVGTASFEDRAARIEDGDESADADRAGRDAGRSHRSGPVRGRGHARQTASPRLAGAVTARTAVIDVDGNEG